MDVTIYRLNNEVDFIPEKRMLSRCDGSIEPVTFNAPAAKILAILLSRTGITTQQELYNRAWRDNGIKTTPNNLYQNISIVRRGIAKIFQQDGEYIITVPRKGFYFNPQITISTINQTHTSTALSDVQFMATDNVHALPETNIAVKNEPEEKGGENKANIISQVAGFFTLSRKRSLMVLCIFITVLLACATWLINAHSLRNKFSDYVFYKKQDNCLFYLPEKSNQQSVADTLFSQLGQSCHLHPYLYVTFVNTFSAVSVIACQGNILEEQKGNECITYFYRGILKNAPK